MSSNQARANAHTQAPEAFCSLVGKMGAGPPIFSACLTLTSLDINIAPKSEKKSTTGTPGFREIDPRRILLQRRGSQRETGEEHQPPQSRRKRVRQGGKRNRKEIRLRSTIRHGLHNQHGHDSTPSHVLNLEMTPVPWGSQRRRNIQLEN